MSRIGKQPIPIPSNVKVEIKDALITITGPKGTLAQEITGPIQARLDTDKKELLVERMSKDKNARARHGLYRALLANMVKGVVEEFEKKLEIIGVGYNAKLQENNQIFMNIGFCHPVLIDIPEGINVEIPNPTTIIIRGANKQMVGQLAANIRAIRPPEPYNGKGIKYSDEVIRRKAGKTFVGGG